MALPVLLCWSPLLKNAIIVIVRRVIFASTASKMTRKSGRASKSRSKARSRRKPKHTDHQDSPEAQANEQQTLGVAAPDHEDVAMAKAPSATSDESTVKADSRQQSASTLKDFEIHETATSPECFAGMAVESEEDYFTFPAGLSRMDRLRYRRLAQTKDSAQDEIRAQHELKENREHVASTLLESSSPLAAPEANVLAPSGGLAATPEVDSSVIAPVKNKRASGTRRKPVKKASTTNSKQLGSTAPASQPGSAAIQPPSSQAAPYQAAQVPTQNSVSSQISGSGNVAGPVKPARKRASGRRRPKSSVTDPTVGLAPSVNTGNEQGLSGLPAFPFQHAFQPRRDRGSARPSTTGGSSILSTQGNSRLWKQPTVEDLNERVCYICVLVVVLFVSAIMSSCAAVHMFLPHWCLLSSPSYCCSSCLQHKHKQTPHFRHLTDAHSLARSSTILPRRDTAALKPCCAWNPQIRRLMAALCLLWARMRVPSIELALVSDI